MIFVTVGTQLTFDRLIAAVDEWAGKNLTHKVVLQSGVSDIQPEFCEVKEYIEASEWEQLFHEAEFIIAHAGMGTILKCLDAGKPLIVMPRLESLGEHRNDHQIATVSKFSEIPGIIVANDKTQLFSAINRVQTGQCISAIKQTDNLNKLIRVLSDFSKSEE